MLGQLLGVIRVYTSYIHIYTYPFLSTHDTSYLCMCISVCIYIYIYIHSYISLYTYTEARMCYKITRVSQANPRMSRLLPAWRQTAAKCRRHNDGLGFRIFGLFGVLGFFGRFRALGVGFSVSGLGLRLFQEALTPKPQPNPVVNSR